MKKRKNTRSKGRIVDIIISVVCVAGISVALFYFYKDVNISLKNEKSEPVGTIYFKKNSAQRRFENRNLWEKLKVSAPIYDGDRLRTGSMSEAYVVMNNNDRIELHENTLIQIFSDEGNTVHFDNGSISVISASDSNSMSVMSGDKVVNLSENSSAIISVQKAENSSDGNAQSQAAVIAVQSGEATIKSVPVQKETSVISKLLPVIPSRQEAVEEKVEVQSVKAGEIAGFEANKNTVQKDKKESEPKKEPEVKKEFSLLMPPANYSVENRGGSASVPFYWKNAPSITVELSDIPEFDYVLKTEKLSSSEGKSILQLENLNSEYIYWRVHPDDAEKTKKSYVSGIFTIRQKEIDAVKQIEEAKKDPDLFEKKQLEEEKRRNEELRLAEERRKREEEARLLEERKKREEEARLAEEKQKKEDEIRKAEEKRKREEELRLAEEKRKREEAARKAEEKRKREEEARLAEEKRKKEEAARKAEEKRKREEEARLAEEKRRKEEAARKAEEKRKREEEIRLAEEKRKKEEAERRAEENRKREEEARIAEEKRRKDEEARLAEEKRKKEEADRIAEENRKREEEARIAEEKRKKDEETRLAEEKRKKEEADRKAEENRKREEEARIAEEKRKKDEEARLAEEKRRKEEAERKAEEKRRREEEARIAEEKRKKDEEARLAEEKRKKEEAERKAEEKRKREEEMRLAEERRKQEEAARKAEEKRKKEEELRLAEEKRRKEEAERLAEERRKKEEELRLAEERRKREEEIRLAEEKRKQEEEARIAEENRKKAETENLKKEAAAEEADPSAHLIETLVPKLSKPANKQTFKESDFEKMNEPSITFDWEKVKYASYYEFELKDSSGKVLLRKTVKETKYVLSKNISLVAESGQYFWSVTAKNKSGSDVFSSKTTTGSFVISLEDVKAASLDKSNLIIDE